MTDPALLVKLRNRGELLAIAEIKRLQGEIEKLAAQHEKDNEWDSNERDRMYRQMLEIETRRSQTQAELERTRVKLKIEKGWVNNYRDAYCKLAPEVDRLRQQVTLRGARLQVMRAWLRVTPWKGFLHAHPEAESWFDEDGVPR